VFNGEIPRPVRIGGCFNGEDPELDSRSAHPRWLHKPAVSLVPLPCEDTSPKPFSLWRIPGRKQLFHERGDLQLWSRTRQSVAQLRLSHGLEDSAAFAYLVPADEWLDARLFAVRETQATYESGIAEQGSATMAGPSRADLLHVRALQVFDATTAGASHRDIADVLFGVERVARKWNSDSELRARVRHFVKRARYYVNGGYLDLTCTLNPRQRRHPQMK
jgi:hypothetical protein